MGTMMDSSTSSAHYRRAGLRKRLFAWAMAHSSEAYEASMVARKRALLSSLHGDILEIGPGTGPNLEFYPAGVRWTGVEPNPFMHPYLLETLRGLGLPPERYRIDRGDPGGVRLPAADESVDAVVSTLVLCSVSHPDESLQEILRVLRPGGQFVFVEHVAAPSGSLLRAFQNALQPAWGAVGDGCHINRETWVTISQAGFARVEIEHYRYPEIGPAGPHISGRAIKGGSGMLQ